MTGSDQRQHDEHRGETPLPLAALIRAVADGEASDADRARMEAEGADGRVQERIAFEHALRQRVGEQFKGPAAPAGLKERVAAALAAASVVGEVEHPAPAEGHGDVPTRERSFWASPVLATLGRWGAIAAVLTIAATLIVNASRSTATSPTPYSAEEASQLVGFIGRQHESCKDFGEPWRRKMSYQTLEEAEAAAAEILHVVPEAFHFREPLTRKGYEFRGLGRCAVPGGDHSVHLLYERPADGVAVSLFIQTNATTELPSTCCMIDRCKSHECAIWQDGPVRYYVFSNTPDAVAEVLEAFNIRREHRKLAPAR